MERKFDTLDEPETFMDHEIAYHTLKKASFPFVKYKNTWKLIQQAYGVYTKRQNLSVSQHHPTIRKKALQKS